MRTFSDFHDAFNFLCNHKMCDYEGRNCFNECLDIEVTKVNPNHIEDGLCVRDGNENDTKTEVWLEFGPIIIDEEYCNMVGRKIPIPMHDYDLDCGGDTFEEAIVNLANLVVAKYGE